MKTQIEYVWLDGNGTPGLRSKTKIVDWEAEKLTDVPTWGFDGSSTNQAEGRSSDCVLKPVFMINDPLREQGDKIVLCEVMNADGTPHASNIRAKLVEVAKKYAREEFWFGIEQEYTLMRDGRPLGWPAVGYPAPQGPYYCGVGADKVFGREVVEMHTSVCMDAELAIWGTNAEVMPGQWEFQIGPLAPPAIGDELWMARWLLARVGEEFDVAVSLAPKPVAGDWNGTGAHTNVSTKATRAPNGIKAIEEACKKLEKRHAQHIAVYGEGNDKRLTGHHETCDINTFRWGVSNRGASIRIPLYTAEAKKGYFEDRRPAANMDPYKVTLAIMETVAGKGFDPKLRITTP